MHITICTNHPCVSCIRFPWCRCLWFSHFGLLFFPFGGQPFAWRRCESIARRLSLLQQRVDAIASALQACFSEFYMHLLEELIHFACTGFVPHLYIFVISWSTTVDVQRFLAASSSDMLGHKLCDLAFCSYAWNDPKAILCDLNLPWSVELCDPRSIDMAERIVSWVWERLVEDDASMEEKQTAFALRRSAGSWALDLISAADFVRFFRGCQLTAQGLAMMQLYGDATWCTSTEFQVWKRLSEAFQLGDDGFGWLQRQASDFCQQAKLSLGELQEPEEKLKFLLRSSKPSHRAWWLF